MARRAAAVAFAALALLLAACGGEDGNGESAETGVERPARSAPGPKPPGSHDRAASPEAELAPIARIDLAIKGVLASAAPDLACGRYATKRYVERAFGSRAGCVHSTVPGSAAHFVEVRKVRIDGGEATATALPSGGPNGGETIKVTLVREGGVWKVDALRSSAPVGP